MIHQYKNNGYNIVLDVNSGSVHVVDEIVYDVIPVVEQLIKEHVTDKGEMLDKLKNFGPAQSEDSSNFSQELLEEALDEILELKDAGLLFTEDI